MESSNFKESESFNPYSVTALSIYPIKSCQGIDLPEVELTPRGFKGDREFMLADNNGLFVNQKKYRKMAAMQVQQIAHGLLIDAPGMNTLEIDHNCDGDIQEVEMYGEKFDALKYYDPYASEWFSHYLGGEVNLIRQSPLLTRRVTAKYAVDPNKDEVNLGDAYPIHLITETSVKRLSEDAGEVIPFDRFRSNIIIPGKYPYNEDLWGQIKIGESVFRLVKAAYRCAITSTNQHTGQIGKEPLKTLNRTRRFEKGVAFGQYLIPEGPYGKIKIGDRMELLKQK